MSDSNVTIKNLEIYHVTENAVLFGPPGLIPHGNNDSKKFFIPAGLISHRTGYEIGEITDIEIPKWLAEKKELDFDE